MCKLRIKALSLLMWIFREFKSHRLKVMKTPLQSEPLWFGLNGVFLYNPSIYAAFQGIYEFLLNKSPVLQEFNSLI